MKEKIKNTSGNTIVEMLIVITIVMVVLTGLINTTTASLKSSQAGRLKSQAVDLAQQAIEVLRSERDTAWDRMKIKKDYGLNGWYCLRSMSVDSLAAAQSNNDTCLGTAFNYQPDTKYGIRVIYLNPDPNTVQINVTVFWHDKAAGAPNSTSLTTRVTKWR